MSVPISPALVSVQSAPQPRQNYGGVTGEAGSGAGGAGGAGGVANHLHHHHHHSTLKAASGSSRPSSAGTSMLLAQKVAITDWKGVHPTSTSNSNQHQHARRHEASFSGTRPSSAASTSRLHNNNSNNHQPTRATIESGDLIDYQYIGEDEIKEWFKIRPLSAASSSTHQKRNNNNNNASDSDFDFDDNDDDYNFNANNNGSKTSSRSASPGPRRGRSASSSASSRRRKSTNTSSLQNTANTATKSVVRKGSRTRTKTPIRGRPESSRRMGQLLDGLGIIDKSLDGKRGSSAAAAQVAKLGQRVQPQSQQSQQYQQNQQNQQNQDRVNQSSMNSVDIDDKRKLSTSVSIIVTSSDPDEQEQVISATSFELFDTGKGGVGEDDSDLLTSHLKALDLIQRGKKKSSRDHHSNSHSHSQYHFHNNILDTSTSNKNTFTERNFKKTHIVPCMPPRCIRQIKTQHANENLDKYQIEAVTLRRLKYVYDMATTTTNSKNTGSPHSHHGNHRRSNGENVTADHWSLLLLLDHSNVPSALLQRYFPTCRTVFELRELFKDELVVTVAAAAASETTENSSESSSDDNDEDYSELRKKWSNIPDWVIEKALKEEEEQAIKANNNNSNVITVEDKMIKERSRDLLRDFEPDEWDSLVETEKKAEAQAQASEITPNTPKTTNTTNINTTSNTGKRKSKSAAVLASFPTASNWNPIVPDWIVHPSISSSTYSISSINQASNSRKSSSASVRRSRSSFNHSSSAAAGAAVGERTSTLLKRPTTAKASTSTSSRRVSISPALKQPPESSPSPSPQSQSGHKRISFSAPPSNNTLNQSPLVLASDDNWIRQMVLKSTRKSSERSDQWKRTTGLEIQRFLKRLENPLGKKV